MVKQSYLPGIEPPPQPEIEEAAQALKEAKDVAKRASDALKHAESILVQRMIDAKVAKHRFHCDGKYVDVEVTLPAPSVKVRITDGDDSPG